MLCAAEAAVFLKCLKLHFQQVYLHVFPKKCFLCKASHHIFTEHSFPPLSEAPNSDAIVSMWQKLWFSESYWEEVLAACHFLVQPSLPYTLCYGYSHNAWFRPFFALKFFLLNHVTLSYVLIQITNSPKHDPWYQIGLNLTTIVVLAPTVKIGLLLAFLIALYEPIVVSTDLS